jgi:Fur family ferric uptake transcriptional regulator
MIEKFQALLRDNGRSVTRSRVKLFEYLRQSGPVSVTQFMSDNMAVADRASLYRALVMFRELGVVEDRIIQGRRVVELTDEYDAHHHHLTCEVCKKSIAVTMPDIEQQLAVVGVEYGFAVTGHVIEMAGVCTDCKYGARSGTLSKHKYLTN